MDNSMYAVIAGSGLVFGYALATALSTPYKRQRIWQQIKCACGSHAPDIIKKENGFLVSRCFHCDHIVVRLEDKNQTIRRVQ